MGRPRLKTDALVKTTSFSVHADDLEFLDALREDGQSRSDVLRQVLAQTREGQPAA
ncbi:MAG: hypothetical protein VYC81_04290 [Actinomycetota bacterium]|nr:hypothetical protein [Actinomycetota bacterium]